VAWLGEGRWFNPLNNEVEVVNGVYCGCWDCTYAIPHDQLVDGGVFYTKSEYRSHLKDKRRAYFARQATKDGMARTKEKTEAELVWEGQPVPTFFDINGDWLSPDIPNDRYLHSRYFRRMFQP
jgi:hypothetical protein